MMLYDVADLARTIWSRALRWAMWSPARLLSVVTVVVLLVAGWAIATADDSLAGKQEVLESSTLPTGWESWPVVEAKRADSEATTESSSESSGSPSATAADESDDEEADADHQGHEPPDAQTKDAAKTAAEKFAAQYVDTSRSDKKWRAAVEPLVIDQLRKSLSSVNPKNIEMSKMDDVEIRALGPQGGVVAVDTDEGTLRLTVTNTGRDWVVSRITPPSGR